MIEFLSNFCNYLGSLGYWGVFFGMLIESSFIPFSSELVMIPAGYACYVGSMDFTLTVFVAALGSLIGAVFNYYLALKVGLSFFYKIGKYVFVTRDSIDLTVRVFQKYQIRAIFFGRLLPVVRQFISIPAGLVKVNFLYFSSATVAGAGLWCAVLTAIGYFFGRNLHEASSYASWIGLAIAVIVIFLAAHALYRNFKKV